MADERPTCGTCRHWQPDDPADRVAPCRIVLPPPLQFLRGADVLTDVSEFCDLHAVRRAAAPHETLR